ncbi:anti-sigma factor antagonist [Dysosmobacter sp. HCP28S3_G4]|uniref:anti-sigma factor antagonist n=1 Tax=Dysosmobacter sp. HCP28S3_G4 TaxID=3438938 RepID=UPI003EFC5248|nr:STAS domain-containing protein [Dysosmobacter sp.]
MEINARSADRNLLLEFSGELDHHGARDAAREVEQAIDVALPRKLVLDFAGVTFMDSSGIAVLLRAQRRMQNLGGSVLVCNVPRQAKRVLDAAGIGRLVTIQAGGTSHENEGK